MGKFADLTGKKFGRLTVVSRCGDYVSPAGKPCVVWKCVCDCGNVTSVLRQSLTSKSTCSCGCFQKERTSAANKTHGESDTRLYHVWEDVKARCYNPKTQYYHIYGGKGIGLCKEWHTFENFKSWAIENGYDENAARGQCTLDRVDGDGDYCPSNCRWATMREQSNNTCRNRLITYKGETLTMSQWAGRVGVSYRKVSWRIRHGWDIERALNTP